MLSFVVEVEIAVEAFALQSYAGDDALIVLLRVQHFATLLQKIMQKYDFFSIYAKKSYFF